MDLGSEYDTKALEPLGQHPAGEAAVTRDLGGCRCFRVATKDQRVCLLLHPFPSHSRGVPLCGPPVGDAGGHGSHGAGSDQKLCFQEEEEEVSSARWGGVKRGSWEVSERRVGTDPLHSPPSPKEKMRSQNTQAGRHR